MGYFTLMMADSWFECGIFHINVGYLMAMKGHVIVISNFRLFQINELSFPLASNSDNTVGYFMLMRDV